MLPCRRRRVAELRALFCWLSIFCLLMGGPVGVVLADKNKAPKQKKKKRDKASAAATGSPGEQTLTNIPLPIGHEAKGLVLPDFDLTGKLVGRFEAGTARRLDEEQVEFSDLRITTFTPENQIDLQIAMQASIFNLKTRVLSSKTRSTIRRSDFNIEGDTVEFDTATRTGRLIGNVKMVINNKSNLLPKPTPAESARPGQ
jgi:hypothetical protein